jgi:preprotein translocase subunit SecG
MQIDICMFLVCSVGIYVVVLLERMSLSGAGELRLRLYLL